MKVVRLESMPYAQCRVRLYDDGTIVFQSYNTDVIEVTPDGMLTCTGIYSRTTGKQIGRFMREYGFGSYYTAKEAYLAGKAVRVIK